VNRQLLRLSTYILVENRMIANYNIKLSNIWYHWQLSMASLRLCETCLLHIKPFVVNKSAIFPFLGGKRGPRKEKFPRPGRPTFWVKLARVAQVQAPSQQWHRYKLHRFPYQKPKRSNSNFGNSLSKIGLQSVKNRRPKKSIFFSLFLY